MPSRAEELAAQLQLEPHPEGGRYRQVFRSAALVRPDRRALTAIYFLLQRSEISRWHRVRSDEVWTHVEGANVTLWSFDGADAASSAVGPLTRGAKPFVVIPANVWQAAEIDGEYALVACFVAPGFEFADFTMMSDDRETKASLERLHPALARFV